jgi:hypothetical protein
MEVRGIPMEEDPTQDVSGYDAFAWAKLAACRADDARAQIAEALALDSRDATLLYRAGMIERPIGDDAAAATRAAVH